MLGKIVGIENNIVIIKLNIVRKRKSDKIKY